MHAESCSKALQKSVRIDDIQAGAFAGVSGGTTPSARAAALSPGVSSNSPSETGHGIKSPLLRVTSAVTPLQGRSWGPKKRKNQFHIVHVRIPEDIIASKLDLTLGLSPPQMVSFSTPPTSY